MLKRMCVAFLTYRWFYVFALAMGLVLTATYFMANDSGVSPGKIALWCCITAAFAGNYVGFYIQPLLAPPHPTIIPGFRKAHVGFALSLNGALALLITMSATLVGPWSNLARLTVFAMLWSLGSIWLGFAYLGRASAFVNSFQEYWWLLGSWTPLWGLLPEKTLAPVLSNLLRDPRVSTAIGLLLTGAVANAFVGTQILTRGQARHHRSSLREAGSWESLGPISRDLFWSRTLNALDAIPQSVAGDFFAQVRVLRLTRQLLPPAVVFFMVLAGIGLAQFVGREEFATSESLLLWGLYSAIVLLLQPAMLGNHGMDLRLILRLPLRKSAAIKAYGVSALARALNLWITFIAAVFIGALLPFGLGLKAFPSLRFVIASFAVHLAVFGIMAFISSLQARTAAQTILAFPLLAFLGITAWIVPASFFPLASILLAMGFLWASYLVLCNAEME